MPWTDNKMMVLFDVFGNPRSSFFNSFFLGELATWKPGTKAEEEAFAALMAPENRRELRKWYSGYSSSIDPMAEALRRILEREIGEPLPIGKGK